jgi:hypothetical protein
VIEKTTRPSEEQSSYQGSDSAEPISVRLGWTIALDEYGYPVAVQAPIEGDAPSGEFATRAEAEREIARRRKRQRTKSGVFWWTLWLVAVVGVAAMVAQL